jgi:ribonuclease Z
MMAASANLLIHEATFGDELVERAAEDGHSTVSQAAEVAVKARVKSLILTHISGRYGDVEPLLEAARRIFPNTMIASDLLEVEVPLS